MKVSSRHMIKSREIPHKSNQIYPFEKKTTQNQDNRQQDPKRKSSQPKTNVLNKPKPSNPSGSNEPVAAEQHRGQEEEKKVVTKSTLVERVDYYVRLQPVTADFNGEDKRTEYKEFLGPKYKPEDYERTFKTLCGFLNADGGILYIGVNDINHCVTGTNLSNVDYDEFKIKVVRQLKEYFSPDVSDDLFTIIRVPVVLSASSEIDKKSQRLFVVKIIVKSDPDLVYFIKTVGPLYTAYMRNDGLTKVLTGDQMNNLFLKKQKKKLEKQEKK